MRTITLTVEVQVPEELAERWEMLPAEERNHYAVAASPGVADALMAVMGEPDEADNLEEELDTDLIAALQEGVADVRAGRLHTLEEVDAAIEAVFAARRQNKT